MRTELRWALFLFLALASVLYALKTTRQGNDPSPVRSNAGSEAAIPKASALRITPTEIDFGRVAVGISKTVDLTLANVGLRPVAVYRVGGSCECVSGQAPEGVIAPGTSKKATVSFIALPGRGAYSGSASIVSDEPGASQYTIPVRAEVEEEIAAEPRILHFGKAAKGETVLREARLVHRTGRPFLIKNVSGAPENAEVSLAAVGGSEGGGYKLVVKLQASAPGAFAHTLVLETDQPRTPKIRIPLAGEVESDFRCSPPSLILKPQPPEGTLTGEVTIECLSPRGFRIRSVRDAASRPIRFSSGPEGPGKNRLKLELTDGSSLSEGALGEFLILVDADEEPLHLVYRIARTSRERASE